MKFSRRYRDRIKKSIKLGLTSVITVMLVAIAMFKIVPTATVKQAEKETVTFEETYIGENRNNPKANVAVETGFQQDLDAANVYYIYDLDGLCEFRDRVNGLNGYTADNYSGKTIYLMNDIDMSSMEYWKSIGNFLGNFDGNYHIIKNLNITNDSGFYVTTKKCFGLFAHYGR